MKRLGVILLALDASPSQVTPPHFGRFPQQFAGAHLYSSVERDTVKVQCLAQEHNTMSPARAKTRTDRSGDERTNQEATAPPRKETDGQKC